jgi:hypothetical protein
MAYDIAWLQNATFADLDAAMSNVVTRREVEPVLRTKQGEAIARKLIEARGIASAAPKQQYGIEWLKTATYDALKVALTDAAARPQIELLLRTVEGAKIASELINDKRVVPPAAEPVSEEEQTQIDADNARADAEASADAEAVAPVAEPVAPAPAPTQEAPKTKIVRDYQVEDEQGKPLGRRTHLEGWSVEEIYAKYEAAHTNAVRYAERLKKRVDTFEAATRTAKMAADANQQADVAVVEAKESNDPEKFNEAVNKKSAAQRETEAARRANQQYANVIIESWMDDHKEDYVPCEASAELLNQWMGQNNLTLSYENLERAFQATKAKQPVPERRAVETPAEPEANPQVAATTLVAAPAAPITQPVAATVVNEIPANPSANPQAAAQAPAPTSANAPNTQAARRPGVNGGLQPGTTSAQRPAPKQQTPQQTDRAQLMKEIRNLTPGEYRTKVEKSAEFRQRLQAAGIIDAGVR